MRKLISALNFAIRYLKSTVIKLAPCKISMLRVYSVCGWTMRGSRKFCQRGATVTSFFSGWGEECLNTSISGPSSASITKKLHVFVIFQGGGVRTPCPLLISACEQADLRLTWLDSKSVRQVFSRRGTMNQKNVLQFQIFYSFVFDIFNLFVCLFCCFTSQVNSYGHCGTVSSHNHTFSWAGLNKRLTSNSCTYFRL